MTNKIHDKPIIVSMALIKGREKYFKTIVNQLENQTMRPDKVIVNISKTPFYLDEGFNKIPKVDTNLDLEFNIVANIGSLRKIIPTLRRYWNKNVIILSIDDDRAIHPFAIETLIKAHRNIPTIAISLRGYYVIETEEITSYCPDCEQIIRHRTTSDTVRGWEIKTTKKVDVLNSGCIMCVTPQMFSQNIFDWNNYAKYGVKFSDEQWLSLMLLKGGTERAIIPYPKKVENLYDEQDKALHNSNKSKIARMVQTYKFFEAFK